VLSPNVRRTLFQDDGEHVVVELSLNQQRTRKICVDGQTEKPVVVLLKRFGQEPPPQWAWLTPPFEPDDPSSNRIRIDGLQRARSA
jgi:hypothetical protein